MQRRTRQARGSRKALLVAFAIVLSAGSALLAVPDAGASYHGAPRPVAVVGTRIASLTVVDAFLPQPASPDVAAIYLTVRNSGSRPDSLVGASSTAATGSMLMTENPDGTMGMLPALRIPAHAQASLTPGRDHLMLEQPLHTLEVGQHVSVTLRFRRAGTLTISVPVVPLSWILKRSQSSG